MSYFLQNVSRICSPRGIDCISKFIYGYNSGELNVTECTSACHGTYADIRVIHGPDEDTITLNKKSGKRFAKVYEEYQKFKRRAFGKDFLKYYSTITEGEKWPFANELVKEELKTCTTKLYAISKEKRCKFDIDKMEDYCRKGRESIHNCTYDVKERFKVVEIYFDTPPFDQITHDVKINFVGNI